MMLREIKSVRQIPREAFRRWYTDNDNDLIVWLDKYRVMGFQLLVPGSGGRTVITWHEAKTCEQGAERDGTKRAVALVPPSAKQP
jgi:hypothetical protein